MKNKGPVILLVDDESANLALMIDVLAHQGFDIRVAESGEIALEQMNREPPDLVFLDVVLPGLNGIEICRQIKARADWQDIPVIMLTVSDAIGDKLSAFEAGAVDFLTKPIQAAEVLARAQTQISLRKLKQALSDELAIRLEAEAQLSHSLERAVLLVDKANNIVFSTRPAEYLLHRHFPDYQSGKLPAKLDALPQVVRVHSIGQPGIGRFRVILLEATQAEPGPDDLRILGLTPRESEVLFWISRGKSNDTIAKILRSSMRTVEKHIEHIFKKLGMESRYAAIVLALETMGAASANPGT